MVSEEAKIVTHRLNTQMASQISLIQMAISSVPSMGVSASATKKAAKDLKTLLKDMVDGD